MAVLQGGTNLHSHQPRKEGYARVFTLFTGDVAWTSALPYVPLNLSLPVVPTLPQPLQGQQ